MKFFKKISDTVKDTATSIGSISADLAETGRLKLQKGRLEGTVMDKKTAIGDLFYQAHEKKSDPDINALLALYREIKEIENQMAAIDERLRNKEKANTIYSAGSESVSSAEAGTSVEFILCSQCRQKLSPHAKFCINCGQAQK